VASIAADSNAGVAALQYMVEWFHLSLDLPWCACLVVTGHRHALCSGLRGPALTADPRSTAPRNARSCIGGSPSWRPRARCAAPSRPSPCCR
jgi:hypothetical protein